MAEVDQRYRAAAERGELSAQQCTNCSWVRFPPSSFCPRCLESNDSWIVLSGNATIWSAIRIHKQYFRDGRREVPYTVILVELEEGPWMISGLVAEQEHLPASGTAVKLAPGKLINGLPAFELGSAEQR